MVAADYCASAVMVCLNGDTGAVDALDFDGLCVFIDSNSKAKGNFFKTPRKLGRVHKTAARTHAQTA